jgi:hypothetical protein
VLGLVELQKPPLLRPDVDILSPDKVVKHHTALTLQIMLIAPYVCWITPFHSEQTYIHSVLWPIDIAARDFYEVLILKNTHRVDLLISAAINGLH